MHKKIKFPSPWARCWRISGSAARRPTDPPPRGWEILFFCVSSSGSKNICCTYLPYPLYAPSIGLILFSLCAWAKGNDAERTIPPSTWCMSIRSSGSWKERETPRQNNNKKQSKTFTRRVRAHFTFWWNYVFILLYYSFSKLAVRIYGSMAVHMCKHPPG